MLPDEPPSRPRLAAAARPWKLHVGMSPRDSVVARDSSHASRRARQEHWAEPRADSCGRMIPR